MNRALALMLISIGMCTHAVAETAKTVNDISDIKQYLSRSKCSAGVISSVILVQNAEVLARVAVGSTVRRIELQNYSSDVTCDRGGAFCAKFEKFNAKLEFFGGDSVSVEGCKRTEDAGVRF